MLLPRAGWAFDRGARGIGSLAGIEDHALIGDGHGAALVARDGTIDWLCLPRFDSPACFAALLGTEDNGFWRIAAPGARTARAYWPDTLVLETTFETPDAAAALIDVMSIDSRHLIRIVEGRRGRLPFRLDLRPRFHYGRDRPDLTPLPSGGGFTARAGDDHLTVRGDVPLIPGDGGLTADFAVQAGQRIAFSLSPSLAPVNAAEALAAAEAHWRAWSGRTAWTGRRGDAIRRSSLTLKALCHTPSGGIVAAPTTSLPEQAGGPRNWDYRYCWPRDGSFAALAFAATGHPEEAVAWANWLDRTIGGGLDRMRPVYGPAGEALGAEQELPWLAGHEGARPVRIGNGAAAQHQLDMFGAAALALHAAAESGLVPPDSWWPLRRALADHVVKIWRDPDDGIWEVRGGARHFTSSKIMAWAALDRAIRASRTHGLLGDERRWWDVRDEMFDLVYDRGFDRTSGAFTQVLGGTTLDASLLLAPLVGFLPADDPRMAGTIAAIGRSLTVDGLVKRYRTHETADGLPPGEGVFLACGFWYVAALAFQGRRAAAEQAFERLLRIQNDVGLLAEEYDPAAGRQMGNFPQAFSHLSLIWAALALEGGRIAR